MVQVFRTILIKNDIPLENLGERSQRRGVVLSATFPPWHRGLKTSVNVTKSDVLKLPNVEDETSLLSQRNLGLEPRGPFLESSETFRAHFGSHNSFCMFKAKAS